jgi:hypothetical protein
MRMRNTKEDIETFIPVRSFTRSVTPDRTRNSRCVVFYSLDTVAQKGGCESVEDCGPLRIQPFKNHKITPDIVEMLEI